MRGGVAILVKKDIAFEELKIEVHRQDEVRFPLYSCSVRIFPQDEDIGRPPG